MIKRKKKDIGREQPTKTGENNDTIGSMNNQMVDKIMTPNTAPTTVQGLRDTDDGPYWGHQLPAAALGSSRIS